MRAGFLRSTRAQNATDIRSAITSRVPRPGRTGSSPRSAWQGPVTASGGFVRLKLFVTLSGFLREIPLLEARLLALRCGQLFVLFFGLHAPGFDLPDFCVPFIDAVRGHPALLRQWRTAPAAVKPRAAVKKAMTGRTVMLFPHATTCSASRGTFHFNFWRAVSPRVPS